MEKLFLKDILFIDPDEYADWTLCLNNAPWDYDNNRYIYSFEQNEARLKSHISWHKTKDSRSSFRSIYTKYCLQFIRLDKDKKWAQWLFLGAFENNGIIKDAGGNEVYDLKPIDRFANLAERLIVHYQKHQGDKQAKIATSNIETMEVVKFLEKPYIRVDKQFEGYDHISLEFSELDEIIRSNVDNWRELLSNVNGIYVITDKSNGKLYIGSTYGKDGVWQRWSSYVYSNGSGWDKELVNLIASDPNYAFKNFRFSIVETFLNTDSHDKKILDREKYWKKVFDSINNGYNDN